MTALSRTLTATAAAVASLLAATVAPLAPAVAAAATGEDVVAWVEVEDGVISGGPALNSGDHGNFSGTGSYTFRETGMTSTMTVTAPAAGVYPVHVRYAAGPLSAEENVTRSMGLVANGERQQVSYPMTSLENWETWRFASTEVSLVEGENTLAVQCDRGVDFCRLNFDAVQVGGLTPDPCVAAEPAAGWTHLFDGTFTSFDGWRKAGGGGFGRQTDCTIRSVRGAGATWFTQQQVAPYTLELDWRRNDSNDDSSVYLGSASRSGATPTGGVRVRLGGDDTGVIEPVGGAQVPADTSAVAGAVRPVGEWNTYRIEVTPTAVVLRLNGDLVNSWQGTFPTNGFIGLENRSFLDNVDFRNIRIKPGVDPEVPDPVASTTSITVRPATIRAGSGTSAVTVSVAAPGTAVAGQVEIWVAGARRSTVPVVDGTATAKVGPFTTVGTRTVQARYLGSPTVLPSSSTVGRVVVAKAVATMAVAVQPKKIVKRKTRPSVVVTVRAAGIVPGGVVRVTVLGKTYAGRLSGGRVAVRLPAFRKPGTFRAVVAYAGDARTSTLRKNVTIRVVRR